MKRLFLAVLLSLLAPAAFAVDEGRDANIDMVAHDLHALGRIASLSENLNNSRQVMLAILDSDIRTLRMPREDGTFRWASLQREEGGKVADEKSIEHVYTEQELRYVTVSGPNGYRVVVTVPKKRSTFAANNRVWVRNILVDSAGFDGKTTHHELPVNAWINPGDANGVALPDIGKSVKATAELGVESGNKQAVAEVALIQAKLVDDPLSPYYPAVTKLVQLRNLAAARDINRGVLKTTTDDALLSLPGELEKRTAEQARLGEARKQMALSGSTTGSIAVGDATPDVVNELREIARMMNGTLQEQTDARARMQRLVEMLSPPVAQ